MKKILTILALAISAMTMIAQELHVGDLYYDIIQIEGGYAAQIVYHRSYQDLQSVVIPESITYLGLTMPVTSIDWSAFEDCDSLISVTIPSSVIEIGPEAFDGTALYNNPDNWQNGALWIDSCLIEASEYIPNKYTISDNVRLIAGKAFTWCTSLTLVTIPNSVKSIGDYAFEDCESLTSITIPNSVTYIKEGTFRGCFSLQSITVDAGNTHYDSRNNSNAIIETATNTLIAGCKTTTIPNSVTSIGDYAFYGCDAWKWITITNSVTSIGYRAFEDTEFYDDPSNWENGALYINDCLIKADTNIVGNYNIKENTRLIAEYAFGDCYKLTSVTIPNSVTSIGYGAFSHCTSLTSVTIPKSVTHIGDYAFDCCSSLETIVFEGTWKQWHAIDKHYLGNYDTPAAHVQCTDRKVEL